MNGEPLEIVPVGPEEYAEIADRFARLLASERDFLLLQGEAALALEAAARGLGRPGSRVLNLVSGPYGAALGDWFGQAGASVDELAVPFDTAISAEAVAEALATGGHDVVSVVHAEAATGAVNPLAGIAAAARASGALILVDAVASVGAEPLEIDAWGLDLVVVSAQKALAGPTGASGVVVGPRAWEWLEQNPAAPRRSILSLLDWRERWLGSQRRVLPLIPHHVETRLLGAALEVARREGMAAIVARHAAARDASRRGLRALGVEPWVGDDRSAAAVATTVRLPADAPGPALLDALEAGALRSTLAAAPGPLARVALRIGHTGLRARPEDVIAALAALAVGLRAVGIETDVGGAVEAALDLPRPAG